MENYELWRERVVHTTNRGTTLTMQCYVPVNISKEEHEMLLDTLVSLFEYIGVLPLEDTSSSR